MKTALVRWSESLNHAKGNIVWGAHFVLGEPHEDDSHPDFSFSLCLRLGRDESADGEMERACAKLKGRFQRQQKRRVIAATQQTLEAEEESTDRGLRVRGRIEVPRLWETC